MSQSICNNCRHTNRFGAKFCISCGSILPTLPQPVIWGGQQAGMGTGMLSTNSIIKNRYLIFKKIGQGGMGAVYQVADTQNNHQVLALKEMSDSAIDPAERPQMVAQFEREAKLLQQLNHSNLPYVTDKFSVGDRHYLVMEFINGRTLHEMLAENQRPFSESLVIQWAHQLCNVLGYLHSQTPKIIFRDLKPDNIMITTDDQVKLIDFGIVRFFTQGKKKDTIALGTKGYAAPEQFGSGQTDERSDIYSLGATLFHLLTAEDPESHVMKIPPVRQYNAAVSLPMNELVFRATRPTIQDRFPTMQQMGNSLPSQAQSTSTTVYSNPQPTSSARTPARPTARLMQATAKLTAQWSNQQLMMAGIALLAVILASVWLITPIILGTWFWYYVPIIAILAPAIFAATRRRGLAGIGQAVAAAVVGSVTWYRAGVDGNYAALFAGALVSAGAIEAVLYFLPKITAGMKRDDPGTWKREAAWLGLTAVVGYFLLAGITFNFSVAFRFISLFFAFLLGGIGWFVGDLIYTAREAKRYYP